MRARLGREAQAVMQRFTWTRTIDIVENAFAQTLRRLGRSADIQAGLFKDDESCRDKTLTELEHHLSSGETRQTWTPRI